MSVTCLIDNSEWETLEDMHDYLRRRMKRSTYYEKYLPRVDKLTGEKITFKDYEQYFNTDFVSPSNLKKWLQDNPAEGVSWITDKLIKRRLDKNLKYAPSQIEMRLLGLPSVLWINQKLGDYKQIAKAAELLVKYEENIPVVDWTQPINVIEDTREQVGIRFPSHIKITRTKLDYGDISLAEEKKIVVERKSIVDLCGTMSKGYERFLREIERARSENGYLVICIEDSFDSFKSIGYTPHTKHVKASYSFLAHRIREMCQKFDNIQFCFCNGRPHMSKVVEFILKIGFRVKTVDVQALIDSKVL